MNEMQKLIEEICMEEDISFHLVSKNWIMILEKNDKTRLIAGYKFGLNDHALGLVCDDKYAMYDVLKNYHLPVAEHYIIFPNYSEEQVEEYAKKYQYHLVVKPNEGTCGKDTYQVHTKEELFEKIDKTLKKSYSISISPFYEIKNEYRSIIYKDKIELFYGKQRPIVEGDGEKTIYELLCDFNPKYFEKKKEDENLKRILEKGEIYEYGWQHNLSRGAIPFYVEENETKQKIEELALKVAKRLNIKFASIDIIELTNGEIMVLEINSGVMMENFAKIMENGKEIAKKIYRKAILDLFEEK